MLQHSSKNAILITGGAKRIGQAVALIFADLGFDVALHYNSSKSLAKSTAREIRKKGVKCHLFSCDLSNLKKVEKAFKDVFAKMPHIHTLINSASLFEKDSLLKGKQRLIQKHFNINLFAPYILMQLFAQKCKKGLIINILDSSIVKYKTRHFSYLVTKKALAELTKMAAVELAPHIRVNGIAPGLILPPAGESETFMKQRAKNIPLKKKGDLKFIAQAAVYLFNNKFVTGDILFVDGGEQLINPT